MLARSLRSLSFCVEQRRYYKNYTLFAWAKYRTKMGFFSVFGHFCVGANKENYEISKITTYKLIIRFFFCPPVCIIQKRLTIAPLLKKHKVVYKTRIYAIITSWNFANVSRLFYFFVKNIIKDTI